jgi:hypothetical protein
MMDFAETIIRREPWDTDGRLAELKLTRIGLLTARDVALHEGANATAFHPANSAGTFAYHHGTWALRDQHVGKDWVEDRSDGIESIRNDALKIKVAFCNVDIACHDDQQPQPRSRKGAGAERASGGFLFPDLPQYAPQPTGEYALYYLMVDENGAAELSRPALKGGKFAGMIERIYLSHGGVDDDALIRKDDDNGPADNFDPQVVRK